MTAEKYARIKKWFDEKPKRISVLKAVSKITSGIGYSAYAILIIYLAVTGDMRLIRCIAVTGGTFFLATAVRSGINAPRPYEKLGITPVIPKGTKGRSFPSRHVVCITIITAAWYYINIYAGIFMTAVSIAVMIIRPLAGIHFPRDVIAGAVFSAVCAVVGFVLI